MTSLGQPVKILFDHGESGWGLELGHGRVEINNIPLTDRLNIGDVVETEIKGIKGGRRIATRVVSRKYPKKTAINYPTPYTETYAKLGAAWRAAGMKCEGMLEGHALVAHASDTDPVEVARKVGVTVSLYKSQPKLEPVFGPS